MQRGAGISAYPYVEMLGFEDPLLFRRAPELEFVFPEGEMDCVFRARLQRNSLKSLQLAHGTRGAARPLVNVKLNNRIACLFACVGHFR